MSTSSSPDSQVVTVLISDLAAMAGNISILKPTLFVFSVFLLFHISIATSSTPPYVAVENTALNCGTSNNSNANDGREWAGDGENSKFAPIEEDDHKSYNSTAQTPDPSVDTVPYMTARVSYSQFKYVFPVTSGPKFIRLYFYPVSYSGLDASMAFFTVKAGKFTLLRNFSAYILANYSEEKTLSKEFCINVIEEDDQKLNLTFIPSPTPSTASSSRFYAFINGIEIVSMPNDLYYSSDDSVGIPYVDQISRFYIDETMALEMVVRLNVGGISISPTNDTGMFGEWTQDTNYKLSGGVIPREPDLKLLYSEIENYSAPDDVYRSAISMGPNDNNLLSNLTWSIGVDVGFKYLVRLHFCEIEPNITKAGDRPFSIYIDNKTAEETADVIMVFRDYIVMIEKKGAEGKRNFYIALHPREEANLVHDAILNGMEVFKLSDEQDNLAGPNPVMITVPFTPPAQQSASTTNESKIRKTIFIAIGSGVGFLVVLALVCCVALWKLRKTKHYGSYYPLSKCWCWPDPGIGKSKRSKASSLPEELCRHFSLEEIKKSTHNFHVELIIGEGGFGNAYKGLVDEGTETVAIKRLNPESKQGRREFLTEIEMLSQLRHVHLVSLIGFCNDDGEMILVYGYMTNGTLRHHLYETDNAPLDWKQRLEICIGAACGLNYLHTGMKKPIIHRDVKTTNILLDSKWVAKVSDFGLSKEGLDNTAVSTMVKGTWGYLDPEYAKRQQLTEKSDVYSFGVVLLEVLCARKALDRKLQEEQWNLVSWARKCIENGSMGEIIDPYLKGRIAPASFKVYLEVAESCVRDQGIQRPTMNDVMEKLVFALQRQKEADDAAEKINTDGEHTYTEVLSFHDVGTTGAARCNNVLSGDVLESDSGTGLTWTHDTGLTYPSLDSDSVTCEDVLTDTINSKA
ncbi:receptor-like protein kinase FERONIA [Juglans microcarpa x Juglans regia]|uniref:receptor-like protein kinase FERONIA n=1 Tax=Juglans microcarpa x Juglans regia TaxID=2249226 RepID=UPI001B7EAEC2|nr:receptor-like protein kinase FERONIA [Juglans microcarpa x Juglans regia]